MGDGGLVGAQETMVLPSRWQRLRTSTSCANALRLQRRFRQLAGRVVGTQEGLVLPAPGQRLRSNPMPHDPVTGFVLAVVLASVAPTRKHLRAIFGCSRFGRRVGTVHIRASRRRIGT